MFKGSWLCVCCSTCRCICERGSWAFHVSVDAHIVPCLKDRGRVFVALHVDVYVKGAHGLFMFQLMPILCHV